MLQKGPFSLVIPAIFAATACAAHPGAEPTAPATFGANGYAWPPETLSGTAADFSAPNAAKTMPGAATPSLPSRAAPPPQASPAVVGVAVAGDGCIDALGASGVEFDQVDSVRGVDTPVVVTSKIGPVRYYANGNLPLLLDCRMALTLVNLAPLLREHNVSEVRFSGAYVYRMSSKGHLSLHARGLALDVHEMTIGGEKITVKSGFRKGLGNECAANFPALNRIACSLKGAHVFKEMLTPDYDADHHDHFHIAIAPVTPGT